MIAEPAAEHAAAPTAGRSRRSLTTHGFAGAFRNAGLHRLCRNGWVHLSVIHPDTRKICVYRKGRFEDYVPQSQALARAATSVDWYRGWRDHLEFAKITGEIRSGAW